MVATINNKSNIKMHDFWVGTGGQKWLRFQEILSKGLTVFGRKAMLAAAFSSGERVLDIGCGCGDTSFDITRLIGDKGYVEGIDISNLMINEARRRDIIDFHYNINFKCADVQSQNFESMIYDVAYSRFGVMFFNDPVAAFSNIQQILQPDGRLAFVCWQPVTENQWVRLPLEVTANHVSLPTPPDPDEPDAFSFGALYRVERILEMAGFVDISIEPFITKFNIGANLEEAVTFLTHMGPASSVIESIDLDSKIRAQIVADLFKVIAPYETDDGVNLEAATWVVTAKNK